MSPAFRISSSGLVLLPACLLLVPGVAPSAATEHSVRPDGLGDFPTIQAAVDSAAAGDTIVLEDGVFTGDGNRDVRFFGKDLVVRSRNGPAGSTIDSQGSSGSPHRAFRLDAGETAASRIEGITITGGYVEGPFPESGGGGILVAYGSHPVITGCVFDGNEAGFQGFGGGLLAWEDCDITLTDCTFTGGESGWYGGGFVLRKYCDALVERCTVIGNHSIHAGGGISITRSDAVVNDCYFANNSTDETTGGAVLVKAEARPVFRRCVFVGNDGWGGGALGLGNLPDVTMIDCLFEGNTARIAGVAYLNQGPPTITFQNCTFAINTAVTTARDVFVGTDAVSTFRNSILAGSCGPLPSVYVQAAGFADLDCCVVDGGPAAIVGFGTIVYGPGNVDADPLFCAPESCGAPSPAGDYTLDSLSPAAPSWNPCGLVGAYPVACGATAADAALEVRSWGGVKALYRRAGAR